MNGNAIRETSRLGDATDLDHCIRLPASKLVVFDVSGVATLLFKFGYHSKASVLRYDNEVITIVSYLYEGHIGINDVGIDSTSLAETTYIAIVFGLKAKVSS